MAHPELTIHHIQLSLRAVQRQSRHSSQAHIRERPSRILVVGGVEREGVGGERPRKGRRRGGEFEASGERSVLRLGEDVPLERLIEGGVGDLIYDST